MTQAYRVQFVRIGRNKNVPDLTCNASGEAHLAWHIRAAVRPHLRSRDFDVNVDLDRGSGWVACGMHVAAEFKIEQLGDRAALSKAEGA